MSKKDFLLEIGVEEMPARFVQESREQLQAKIETWLREHHLAFEQVYTYATPRRLAVLVEGLAEAQENRIEEAKGPAKKIAINEQGEWSKAAQGFARSQGVSLDQLFFKEVKGVEYVYVQKEEIGQATSLLLPQMQQIIEGMTFPKNMRWGSHELRFIRPIKWILCLFGSEIIPLEISGISSGRETEGHRFLGKRREISEPSLYPTLLQEESVLASVEERQQLIVHQLEQLEKEQGWQIPIDRDLLDEVTHLVEYPSIIYGSFDQEFLSIPSEVLITSMKEHQRYFPVEDEAGRLLPFFVTIANGQKDREGIIARGNEKVLRARLADARFFYEEDKKMNIDEAASRLANVVFHEELGSIGDKVSRVAKVAQRLAKLLTITPSALGQLERAAQIYKFDLVSQMVYEFPELQGIMGEKYARLAGEAEEVAQAIYEHYLPRFAGDALPTSEVGAVLSVADKIDTIVGCFSIGIIPTGSQDPYALRRQATGIVQIMRDQHWSLPLKQLFQLAIDVLAESRGLKISAEETLLHVQQFFHLRLKNRLQEEQIRYDIIEAILQGQEEDLPSYFTKAHILMKEVEAASFKSIVESFTRVKNIADKLDRPLEAIDTAAFEKEVEKQLYDTYQQVRQTVTKGTESGEWQAIYQALTRLQQPIEQYFEQIMVMVENEQLRYNRLFLLKNIATLIQQYADFSQIVFSSK